ncbi:MAG: TonB-dependent receptor [Chloroherpetonaceae bacterium]|nr:TonB-dependent receptor [Chloroherpetonaceae bacterium]MDW8438739.1 TonB-dependent receptor [Chloroherpetonaceae bacterium]
MKRNALRQFLSTVLILVSASAFAQESGKLVGKVTDKESGEELIGASVVVVGTTVGAKTNIDGEYSLTLKAGKVDLRVSYVGYQTRTVKGVEVKAGQTSRVDIELKPEAAQAEEIVVQAEISNATESALLTQQRKALVVQDGVSAEFIKKTPDSDAGDVIKRVTGVSVVAGKFVFVRGLGERYSNTQINGVTVPSPEPEKKVVPLDVIPANLIENIITVKTFMPDQPGAFAGGLVKVKTKEFPDQLVVNFGMSAGFNSRSHFKQIPSYPGGKLDFLGIDDGTRSLPKNFPDLTLRGRQGLTQQQINQKLGQAGRLLGRTWTPVPSAFAPNQGYSLSIANQASMFGVPMGFIVSGTYSNGVQYKETKLFLPSGSPGQPFYDYNDKTTTYNVNWGAVADLNIRVGEGGGQNNKIGFKALYNRTAEDETREVVGSRFTADDAIVKATRLRFVSRELLTTQLAGTHYLRWLFGSELEWKAALARARRDEPDNREAQYIKRRIDPDFIYDESSNRNTRFFADLADNEQDALLDWSIPFNQWSGLKSKLKIGGLYTDKSRNFQARRFDYRPNNFSGLFGVKAEQLFSPDSLESGRTDLRDNTFPQDRYEADEKIRAGYAMVELPLTYALKFVGGARVEQNKVSVRSDVGLVGQPQPVEGGFDRVNFLPSVNFIYSIGEQMNVRASFSRTVAFPELREVAPFNFDDYRTTILGNPFIDQTRILNYDLRWEWYPRIGEILAVSAFYKSLDEPLERIVFTGQGSTIFFTTVNADKATNYGMEFEARKRLDFIAPSLENFNFGLNLTLVNSSITLKDRTPFFSANQRAELVIDQFVAKKRPMQGQAPYVLNLNFGYNNVGLGLEAALLYNIVGRKIVQVGTRLSPEFAILDIYEEPRNQLDFFISKRFGSITTKMTIRNILDARYFYKSGNVVVEDYRIGQTYALSISYSL